ncbi:hypothetical protein [Acidaminococcus timonensis]|uniref:hypothetical protein n=1 Tax=Acidaminococcus timonensis TaxID=1871002 RepID=UPI00307B666B
MMQDEGQEGNRTSGEAVHGMPVDGAERIRPLLATLGIPRLPGLPEAGAYHRCMPYGSGQEAMMGIKKWIPMVLITAVVLTVTWMTMMYIVVLYILFGGGI